MYYLQKRTIVSCMVILVVCSQCFSKNTVINGMAWIVHGGIKHGSIVGRSKDIDGLSGASKTLWDASAGTELTIRKHHMEIGISIGETDQRLQLSDPQTETGNRNISLLLMDIPVLYNFHFSPYTSSGETYDRIIVGIGAFVSVVLEKEIETAGMIQSGKLSNWAAGPYLRLAGYPLNINGVQPGIYLDIYRSFTPRYFYNQPLFRQNGISGQLGSIDLGVAVKF